MIVRPDAISFLTDLERRLTVYRAHPTGQTPELLNAEVVNLLRRPDEVGLRELLKGERRSIIEKVRAGVAARHGEVEVGDFPAEVLPSIERYLAAVLPLIEHESPLWTDEVRALGAFAGERLFDQGLVHWIEMPRWIAWYIAYAAGAFAIAVDNLDACRTMFETRVSDSFYDDGETFGTLRPRESASRVGAAAMQVLDSSQNWRCPHFEHVLQTLDRNDFLRNRYPELSGNRNRLLENLSGFNALATLVAAKNETPIEGDWTMYGGGAKGFLTRLVRDQSYRACVSEIIDVDPEQLVEVAPVLLDEGCWKPAGYNHADIEIIFWRRA